MSDICENLHKYVNTLPRFYYSFNEKDIPKNGISIFFESGEKAHGGDRIVMVGSHTGDGQLRGRLKEHFQIRNKDRSMFRKTIGRSILNVRQDPYLKVWDMDMIPRENRERYGYLIDREKKESIEHEITWYICDNFSFCVIGAEDNEERIALKSKLISTISICTDCKPSVNWLGLNSPKKRISESGLWQEKGLYGETLAERDLERIKSLCGVNNP